MWEEQYIPPVFVLEMVSHAPGGEYDSKLDIYRKLEVLYYLIYNPDYWQRDRHQPFELYKLVDGAYHLQIGEPFWMPEIGLGIGRHHRPFGDIEQEFLYWYDQHGTRHLSTDEQIEVAKLEAQSARQEAQLLGQKLRELGVDPDSLTP